MPDVSITDLTTEARKKFRESPGWELGIYPGSDLDLVRRLADALEAAERDAQQAEDQANNLAGDVVQLEKQVAALQAVIAEVLAYASTPVATECDEDGDPLLDVEYVDGANGARRDVKRILAQAPTDALEAVKEDAWYRAIGDLGIDESLLNIRNPYRAKTEGEKR